MSIYIYCDSCHAIIRGKTDNDYPPKVELCKRCLDSRDFIEHQEFVTEGRNGG